MSAQRTQQLIDAAILADQDRQTAQVRAAEVISENLKLMRQVAKALDLADELDKEGEATIPSQQAAYLIRKAVLP